MKTFELITFQTPRALAETAALAWLGEVSKSERADRLYCVALSGGRIAGDFFSAIVDLAKVQRTVFRKVHFFWADERCLPPSDEQSNYRVARERLLDPLGIPAVQIHRLLGEVPSEVASKTATEELSRLAAHETRTVYR